MRMFFKSIRNYILSLSMNAFYTTNESSTRHHISDTGYEQPRNEDYDVCPPSESDCPMITVWRWPSLVLSPASDTSTHFHIITLTQCKCQMFTNSWVKLSRSPMLGSMVVVTNPLRWSSSGCMTLRQSRRQGKSRISEMKLHAAEPAAAAATTKPPINNKTLCRSSCVLYSCTQEMSSSSTKPFWDIIESAEYWNNDSNSFCNSLEILLNSENWNPAWQYWAQNLPFFQKYGIIDNAGRL